MSSAIISTQDYRHHQTVKTLSPKCTTRGAYFGFSVILKAVTVLDKTSVMPFSF